MRKLQPLWRQIPNLRRPVLLLKDCQAPSAFWVAFNVLGTPDTLHATYWPVEQGWPNTAGAAHPEALGPFWGHAPPGALLDWLLTQPKIHALWRLAQPTTETAP